MIIKPTLLLDETKCRANIKQMVARARSHQVKLRPHFKTHQSLEIGRWFKEEGIDAITVSSLDMALYFSPEWDDITVAFPVNFLQKQSVQYLSEKIKLNLLFESEEAVQRVDEILSSEIGAFVKINIGNNRAGLKPDDRTGIDNLIKSIVNSRYIRFKGFLGHAGQTYACRSTKEIEKAHSKARKSIVDLKDFYSSAYPEVLASYGDTPSCSVARDFQGIDELRPGNFVFYDIMQVNIGSCFAKDIAVAMACPVVAKHEEQNELIIYGGGIHFSKDSLVHPQYGRIFGIVAQPEQQGWSEPLAGTYIRSLSQEHGIVLVSDEHFDQFEVGDILYVLPVHSCMTANLMRGYKTLDGRFISMFTFSQ